MHVHAVGVKRQVSALNFFIVDGHEHQVDIGLLPYRIVRQATTKEGCQYCAVFLHVDDECVELLRRKPAPDRLDFSCDTTTDVER